MSPLADFSLLSLEVREFGMAGSPVREWYQVMSKCDIDIMFSSA